MNYDELKEKAASLREQGKSEEEIVELLRLTSTTYASTDLTSFARDSV